MKNIIIIFLLNIIYLFNNLYNLQMLQQNTYNLKLRYFKFQINDYKKNIIKIIIKIIIIIILFFIKLNIIFYIILIIILLNDYINYDKHNDKLPLKFTKRVLRIFSLNLLLLIIMQLFIKNESINYFVIYNLIFIVLNPFVLIFIVWLLKPIEKMIYNKYKNKALEKLNKMNNISIIGITGSFGKTSTKMILNTILKTTYKGFCTPSSYNTPVGTLLTINQESSIFNDYFISEMGAKCVGDIQELCDLVHPKYGIITSIGAAHLESFKSIENVCQTKFELIESLPSDGIAILNKDDEYQVNYRLKNKCRIIWIGIKNKADVMAKNIKITNKGTTFDIVFKEKVIKVSTILLGEKNIYNILASVALANELNVSEKSIIQGVKNIEPINHRLEIKNINNITLIDDSFNSNPIGAKNALEVLKLMDGLKIIITPGMIEMGQQQETLNETFGRQMAEVCDIIYLVGKNQTKPIYNGLKKMKFKEENIFICNSFKNAYNEVLTKFGNDKITILIENDLPDSYMEG